MIKYIIIIFPLIIYSETSIHQVSQLTSNNSIFHIYLPIYIIIISIILLSFLQYISILIIELIGII